MWKFLDQLIAQNSYPEGNSEIGYRSELIKGEKTQIRQNFGIFNFGNWLCGFDKNGMLV